MALLTGAVIRRDLELDPLAVGKRAEARGVDLRLVHEDVAFLAVDRDEAKALGRVEPFAGARDNIGTNFDHQQAWPRLHERRTHAACEHEAVGGGRKEGQHFFCFYGLSAWSSSSCAASRRSIQGGDKKDSDRAATTTSAIVAGQRGAMPHP